jgi:mono/diheme cytochrome c family protein
MKKLACIFVVALFTGTASAETSLQRGGMLDTGRLHAGGPQTWETSEYKVKGSNITPDKDTGIGAWSENDVKRAIRDGVRPTGQQLAPQMPYGYHKIFTPADLDAVVAYVRSLPAVSNKVEVPVYKAKKIAPDVPAGAEKPMPESALQDPVKRGFYLVTIGHCMECHSPRHDGTATSRTASARAARSSKARGA